METLCVLPAPVAVSRLWYCPGALKDSPVGKPGRECNSSVQFSRSVVSSSLRPHERQHVRPPCPSPTPGVHPNPCPLSRWCQPTISSSVILFSSPLQSFPASGSFQMSQPFSSCGQSISVLAFNISPSNEYPGLISFRMDWLDLLAVQGTLKNLGEEESTWAPSISFLKLHVYL